jgi:hypothetical protein
VSIDAPEHVNGSAPPAPVRVKFGPGTTDDIPLDWAEFMLVTWRDAEMKGSKPPSFTAVLGQAVLRTRAQT